LFYFTFTFICIISFFSCSLLLSSDPFLHSLLILLSSYPALFLLSPSSSPYSLLPFLISFAYCHFYE
jgi:hypothetical protein